MLARFRTLGVRSERIVKGQLARRPWLVVVPIVAVSFTVFAAYSIARYSAFQTTYYDLGLEANSIWRTLNGYDSWASLIFPSTQGHINHISPILGLVALVYAVVPDPRTLLVLQAAIVSAASIPLYLLVLRETRSQLLPAFVAGLYLANPALHGIVRYDFHAEAFIPLSVFLLYYSYGTRSSVLFYASLVTLLSTIEYAGVIGLGISISWWLYKKTLDKRIVATLLTSLALITVVIASTLGGAFQAWNWPSNWLAVQFFEGRSSQATSYLGWLIAVWANPGIILSALTNDLSSKVTYLVIVMAPLWFAAIGSSLRMTPAFPWIAIILFTSRQPFYSVDFQYSVFLIPFIYLGAITFLHQLVKVRKLLLSLAAIAMVAMLFYSAISPVGPHGEWPSPSPLGPSVDSIITSLPRNATILTQNDLFPQLSNMPYVMLSYTIKQPPQFILVNTDSSWYNWTNPELGVPLSAQTQVQLFTGIYQYQLIVANQGLRLYRLQSHFSALSNPSDKVNINFDLVAEIGAARTIPFR